MSKIDQIIVSRLLEIYDPWGMFRHRGVLDKNIVFEHDPKEYVPEEKREWDNVQDSAINYDYGRIHYFALKDECDPIEMDNVCDGGKIYPYIVLLDGHHRVMAWDLMKRKTIPCHYAGLVSLLEYLTGESDELPEM